MNDKLKWHNRQAEVHQISFFERLLDNEYTKNMIEEFLIINQSDDYMGDILYILDEVENSENQDIRERCKNYKYIIDMELKAKKKNNPVFNQLEKIFNESGGDSQLMYDLLRFDNPIYK